MDRSSEFGSWTRANEEIFLNHFPLHRACRDGDHEALGSLLSATGDRDFYMEDSFYGWTPIHWAAYFGKLPCLMKLLEHNANCDVPTERLNQTPIHVAAYGGYGYCVKWLLHCGARINRQDYMGETPVHKAARTGSMECVSLLVSQGAKLSIRNHSGNTPSQLAILCGHQECGNYLEKALQIQQQANPVHEEMRNHVTHPRPSPSNISSSADMSKVEKYVIKQGLYGGFIPQPNENNNVQENGPTLSSTSHTGPPKQYVNTDYQGTTIFVQSEVAPMPNGVPSMSNGIVTENNNVLAANDCDMEMEAEVVPVGQICNGVSNGLHNGGSESEVASGGMKRCREDMDGGSIKRARSEESMTECCMEESAYNNNIVSSYNAVLAISVRPMRTPTGRSQDEDGGHRPDLKHVLTMQSCWSRKAATNHMADRTNGYTYVNGQSQNHEIHQQSFDNQVIPTISTSLIEHYCSVTAQQGYDSLLASSLVPR